jgi:hypothetical protein
MNKAPRPLSSDLVRSLATSATATAPPRPPSSATAAWRLRRSIQRCGSSNAHNFAAREFYSAGTGELLAADVASSGVTTTYWALNDKNGAVRDVVYYSGGSYNTAQIDYTAGGRATVAPQRFSTAPITRRSPRGTAQSPTHRLPRGGRTRP